jgi:hypothetical protein
MKKFIQICSLLSLVFVFTIVSAQAQTVKTFEAEIPFDFNVAQKSYSAGTYIIKVMKSAVNTKVVTLEDEKGNLLQSVVASTNGDTVKDESILVFNRYENKRFLTKLLTNESGILVAMSKTEKLIAKQERNSQTQVALVKSNK